MSTEPWEFDENPTKYYQYNWWSDDVPSRKFYLFLAEIGRRLRHLMTDEGPIQMIELCERCAEGQITEDELGDLSDEHRPHDPGEEFATNVANNLYWWVPDRYKVDTRGVSDLPSALAFRAMVEAELLAPEADAEAIQAVNEHPVFATAYERAELELTALLCDIYGPNPFQPIAFSPSWRTDTAVTLARQMYEAREFGAMPILADALQDAGCDNDNILAHCRDPKQVHVRGCWVIDLVLGKS